jgi:hypothetical protein
MCFLLFCVELPVLFAPAEPRGGPPHAPPCTRERFIFIPGSLVYFSPALATPNSTTIIRFN